MSKFITEKNVYLRPFIDEDVDLLFEGLNDETVRETLFTFRPKTKHELLEEYRKDSSNQNTVLFTICELSSGKAVGITAFYRVDYVSRAAVFFIAIYDTSKWNSGYGTQATRLMIKYAFDVLNLNRIQLHVALENTKAVEIYKKCGFVVEGTLRQAMYHHNRYVDFYVMGILRNEYYSNKNS